MSNWPNILRNRIIQKYLTKGWIDKFCKKKKDLTWNVSGDKLAGDRYTWDMDTSDVCIECRTTERLT